MSGEPCPMKGAVDQGKNHAARRVPTSYLVQMHASTGVPSLPGGLENGYRPL